MEFGEGACRAAVAAAATEIGAEDGKDGGGGPAVDIAVA